MCVFSLLVAELVTGGCLPRSDTPAGLQQGDKGRKPQLHLSLWVFTLCVVGSSLGVSERWKGRRTSPTSWT